MNKEILGHCFLCSGPIYPDSEKTEIEYYDKDFNKQKKFVHIRCLLNSNFLGQSEQSFGKCSSCDG